MALILGHRASVARAALLRIQVDAVTVLDLASDIGADCGWSAYG